MKKCYSCKKTKPSTIEYFYKNKRYKDGLTYECKVCAKNQNRNNRISLKSRTKQNDKWGEGVYGLYSNGICLYVGKSKILYQRMLTHFTSIKTQSPNNRHPKLYKALKQHSNLIFGIIEQCNNHKEKETYYIDKYKPLYNSQLKGTTTT